MESMRARTCQSVRASRALCRSAARFRGHARAAIRIARNGQLNAATLLFQGTLHEGDVSLLDGALAKRLRKPGVRKIIFRHKEDSRSFLVQAMDDAGPQQIAGLREGLPAAQQRVDKRSVRVPRSGVHGHARGFVDGDDVLVLVENIKWDRFGFRAQRRARLKNDLDGVACADLVRIFRRLPVQQDQPARDELLHTRAGKFGAPIGNHAIQAQSCVRVRHRDFQMLRFAHKESLSQDTTGIPVRARGSAPLLLCG